jgi:tyrosine-protein kinase Etk/Wzc
MIVQETDPRLARDTSNAESSSGYSGVAPGITLFDSFIQISRNKWFVAKVTAIAILLATIVSLLLTVRYTAKTKIMPPQQNESIASMMMDQFMGGAGIGSLSSLGGGLGLKNPNDIYIGLLNSRPVADALIQKFDLQNVYHGRDSTAVHDELTDNTVIESEKDGLISVAVTDKDKKRAADIANAYIDQLRVLTQSLGVSEASHRRMFYDDELKQAKEMLAKAEVDFQKVQQQKGLIQLTGQAKVIIESLAALRAEVVAKEVQLQVLRSFSTDRNPDVQLAERELSMLRGETARAENKNTGSGFSNLGMADVPVAGLEYIRAQREVLYRQTLYDLLIKQYEAARMDEAKEATLIQVVEPAIEPDRKSSPKRALIVLIVGTTTLFGSMLYVLIRGSMQGSPWQSKWSDRPRLLKKRIFGYATTEGNAVH